MTDQWTDWPHNHVESIFVSQFQILPESVELIARLGPQGEQPPLEQWKQATTSSPKKIFQVDSLFGSWTIVDIWGHEYHGNSYLWKAIKNFPFLMMSMWSTLYGRNMLWIKFNSAGNWGIRNIMTMSFLQTFWKCAFNTTNYILPMFEQTLNHPFHKKAANLSYIYF